MARHKNVEWSLPDGEPNSSGSHTHQWASIHAAVLMDIRDELRTLNQLLNCPNFQAIPAKLDRIQRNTAKPKKRKTPTRARRV